MALECPILTATRKGKKVSKNPCQDCGKYGDCQDDLARDLSEEMLKLVGAYYTAVIKSGEEYTKGRRKK